MIVRTKPLNTLGFDPDKLRDVHSAKAVAALRTSGIPVVGVGIREDDDGDLFADLYFNDDTAPLDTVLDAAWATLTFPPSEREQDIAESKKAAKAVKDGKKLTDEERDAWLLRLSRRREPDAWEGETE